MKPKMKNLITQKRLHEVLDYSPETGEFVWKQRNHGVVVGKRAGSVDPNGYRYVRVDQKDYLAQRLAWFWTHNEWPGFLRFEDGDRDNSAISNLRDSAYVRSKDSKHDWRTKEGKSAQQKEYRSTRMDHVRGLRMKNNFGINLSEYQKMLVEQKCVCAICSQPETAKRNGKVRWLAVDHCHETDKVRGLLCGSCNPMIGYAKDSVEVLTKAISYLQRHKRNDCLPDNVFPLGFGA